jgi:16S rRNA (guanine(527)-N(7))-methyltransferase RsmG
LSLERPPSPEQAWSELRSLVERQGGGPKDWEREMEKFLDLLRSRNRVVNLVSRVSMDRVVELQVIPSLAGLLVLEPGSARRVLDIGSGGGFPAIPLKILRPSIRLDLVEATQKKARFLSDCMEKMGFDDARVHACRIEKPSLELRDRAPFDVAFARAVGQEDIVSRSVRPLLEFGAPLWTFSSGARSGEASLTWAGMDGRTITCLRRLLDGEPLDRDQGDNSTPSP